MKKSLLSLLVLFSFSLAAQQAKQVYITLDVSGSMYGAKYELANYTTQMIVSMCDAKDDVYIIVTGKKTKLSQQSKVLENLLQHSLPTLPLLDDHARYHFPINVFDYNQGEVERALRYRDYEVRDIQTFNKVYQPSTKKENWIFIIGDGDWEDAENHEFKEIVEGGTLNVCYLQTGNPPKDDFTQFARTLGVVDIRKSDTDPSSIKLECDYFARKILGFSNTCLDLKKNESNDVVFSVELPVSEFLIVYQDKITPSSLPKINQVNANGQLLNYQLKGSPSTDNLFPPYGTVESNNKEHVLLSGRVWRVQSSSSIPAGQSVTVSFDKDVDLNNVRIYPICKSITSKDFIPVPISINRKLEDLHSGTYAICKEKDWATIIISLSENAEKNIPEELLKKTKVTVTTNNMSPAPAIYENGHFTCDIKLKSDKTQYKVEIEIPGYKQIPIPFQTIEKTDNCEEEKEKENENENDNTVDTVRPPIPLGEVQFQQHMVLKFTLNDKKTKKLLNPNDFDLSAILENGFLFEEPRITVSEDTVYLFIDAKEDWCECLLPKDLKGEIMATPKKGIIFENGTVYSRAVLQFHATLEREKWFVRCQWVLLVIGGLLLLVIYLRLMLRKKRFKKNAMMNPFVWSKTKDEYIPQGGYRLRKKGFAAWFSRWFLPFDEKRSISMTTPLANFTFTATESRARIRFPKTDFKKDTMIVTGYDPERDKKKDAYIKLSDGGIIEILKGDGSKDGKLQFVAGKKNDEGLYHLFLGLLVLADMSAIVFLTYLMIRAI